MANKRFNRKNKKPEFDQKLLDLARVVRVVKGGRRFSFRATMIIGNRKGKVGLGVAQGSDVAGAINKAVEAAKKSMIIVKRLDSTISYRVDEFFCGAQIMIKPAKEGKGIVAGGAMRLIFELAGIRNITAKSLGSSNKINVAKATLKALDQLEGKKHEIKNHFTKKPVEKNQKEAIKKTTQTIDKKATKSKPVVKKVVKKTEPKKSVKKELVKKKSAKTAKKTKKTKTTKTTKTAKTTKKKSTK
jgi:small subunit ribosomal protein S5